MRRLYALAAPFAVIAALMVMPAVSSASTTIEKAGTPLAIGEPITANSSNLIFETTHGNLECSNNELNSTLTGNGGEPATAEITGGSFTGPLEPDGDACETSVTTEFGKAHARIVYLWGMPWWIGFFHNGNSVVTSLSLTFPLVTFQVKLYVMIGGQWVDIAECVFGAYQISDRWEEVGGKLIDSVNHEEMTLQNGEEEAAALCAPSGKLNGSFELTSNGSPLEVSIT